MRCSRNRLRRPARRHPRPRLRRNRRRPRRAEPADKLPRVRNRRRARRSRRPQQLPLTTQKQKGSYAIGLRIGGGLQKDGVDLDAASLSRGIRDALSGAKPLLTDQEAQAALTVMATEVRAKQQAKLDAVGTANKQQGDAFLAENKTKDGRGHAAERPAVQDSDGGHGTKADRGRTRSPATTAER